MFIWVSRSEDYLEHDAEIVSLDQHKIFAVECKIAWRASIHAIYKLAGAPSSEVGKVMARSSDERGQHESGHAETGEGKLHPRLRSPTLKEYHAWQMRNQTLKEISGPGRSENV
nr:hypothetical protein CFP56_22567 [Quercus suber]